ncbi:MAG: hypothetical protein LUE27_05255, partial [Clostridia bacterium]|nr:hypothetical protein [Clostridia bacterium]
SFGDIFKGNATGSSSRQRQRPVYEPPKRYTPEEFVVLEQEQSGERWRGVPLSELSKVAQTTYRGRYVKVDQYGFLVFHYSSKSRKTSEYVQCTLGEDGLLKTMPHGYYPWQWRDSSDEFIEKANQQFVFH